MEEIIKLYEETKSISNKVEKIRQLKIIRIKLMQLLISHEVTKIEKAKAEELMSKLLFSLN